MIEIKKEDDIVTKRIKKAMNDRGYTTQKEFCESFKDFLFQESLLTDILSNKKRRTIDNLSLIADKLNISLDYIVGKNDIMEIDNDIKAINKYTRLSESAINKLKELDQDLVNVLDEILLDDNCEELLEKIHYYFLFDNVSKENAVIYNESYIKAVSHSTSKGSKDKANLITDALNQCVISNERIEELLLKDIGDAIKEIKKYTNEQIIVIKECLKPLYEINAKNNDKEVEKEIKKLERMIDEIRNRQNEK